MNLDLILLTATLIIGIALFISDKFRPEVISMGMMTVLILSQIITPQQAFSGFSNPAIITIAAMFVISYALTKSGALALAGMQLGKIIRYKPLMGLGALTVGAALMSAFLNNTPIVAVLIPVVIQAASATQSNANIYLIPLSYATILGGTTTLLGTSTNILAHSLLTSNGLPGFHLFEFTGIGFFITFGGLIYLVFFSKYFLPDKIQDSDLQKKFSMSDYLAEFQLTSESRSIDKPIMNSPLVKELDMEIIEVIRSDSRFLLPPKDMILKKGDILKVRANARKLQELRDRLRLLDHTPILFNGEKFQTSGTSLLELLIPAGSEFEGKTLKQLEFKRHYRGIPLAIRQRDGVVHDEIEKTRLKAGDVLLVEMKTVRLDEFRNSSANLEIPFVILNEDITPEFNKYKLSIVSAVLLLVVMISALGFLSIETAALAGVFILLISKAIQTEDIYRSIQWNVLFLIGSLFCLSTAMTQTGLDQKIAQSLYYVIEPLGPYGALAGIFITTFILTEFLSNNASVVLMIPIALKFSETMGLSPMPFVVAATLAASMSFLTPIGYQTNTMVYTAGGYQFKDFFKAGLPLSIFVIIASIILIPMFFSF